MTQESKPVEEAKVTGLVPHAQRIAAFLVDGLIAPAALAIGLLIGEVALPTDSSKAVLLAALAVGLTTQAWLSAVSAWLTEGQTLGRRSLALAR